MREPRYVLEKFEVGIKREYTLPHNHQQDGVIERKNRCIVEIVKVMIHDQPLPMFLWEEASMNVVYVQNIIPRGT
jgi:hypothetical protein